MAVERVEPASIEERIDTISRETGAASSTLYALVFSESSLNPEAKLEIPPTKGCPDGSVDRGLVMINDCYWPDITDEQAYDPEWALRWAAEKIKAGDAWKTWAVCNCYSFAKAILHKDLPAMKDLAPNGPPRKGAIAIFDYNGTKHLAVITEINEANFKVRESNLKPCSMGTRYVRWDSPHLKGFYTPGN